MANVKSPTDIYKILDRSNCRQCGELSCLAFAVRVFKGERRLDDCPRVDPNVVEGVHSVPHLSDGEESLARKVAELRSRIARIDVVDCAERVGGARSGSRITIRVLGKEVSVDGQGNLYSDIHVHSWITITILSYLVECKGVSPTGNWVPLRKLPNGKTWYRLFGQRCEQPLKKVADKYTSLFEDMIQVFKGKALVNDSGADIALVLYPLPKVPILIRYWKPEEGMDSTLNVLFDEAAEENLNIESIYALVAGLVRMFEKISSRHG